MAKSQKAFWGGITHSLLWGVKRNYTCGVWACRGWSHRAGLELRAEAWAGLDRDLGIPRGKRVVADVHKDEVSSVLHSGLESPGREKAETETPRNFFTWGAEVSAARRAGLAAEEEKRRE